MDLGLEAKKSRSSMPFAINLQESYCGSDKTVISFISLGKNAKPGMLVTDFKNSSLRCFMVRHSNRK